MLSFIYILITDRWRWLQQWPTPLETHMENGTIMELAPKFSVSHVIYQVYRAIVIQYQLSTIRKENKVLSLLSKHYR